MFSVNLSHHPFSHCAETYFAAAIEVDTALPQAYRFRKRVESLNFRLTLEEKGTVTSFEWSNPHAYIHVDVKDDKGNVEQWTAEMASLGMLSRVNWRKDTVKPGDQITISGNRAKNGKTVMRLDKIVFANGQELSARVT